MSGLGDKIKGFLGKPAQNPLPPDVRNIVREVVREATRAGGQVSVQATDPRNKEQILHDELVNDPLSLGYSSKADQQCANILNAETQQIARTSITGDELLENTAQVELVALTIGSRTDFWGFVNRSSIPVGGGTNTRAILAAIFPANSATRTNLMVLLATPILASRAAVLGLPFVGVHHIASARSK